MTAIVRYIFLSLGRVWCGLVRKDVVRWFMLALLEELTSDPPVENTEARGATGVRREHGTLRDDPLAEGKGCGMMWVHAPGEKPEIKKEKKGKNKSKEAEEAHDVETANLVIKNESNGIKWTSIEV